MGPRVVRTPVIRPPATSKPVTSQSWMMSTPSLSAPRAYAPRDAIVARDPAAALVRGAEDRVADVRRHVDDRADLADLGRRQPLGVDAVDVVRRDAPPALRGRRPGEWARLTTPRWLSRTSKSSSASRRLPELEGELVDAGARVPEVVGADDRGVAAHVPEAEDARAPGPRRPSCRGSSRGSRRSPDRGRRRRR